MTPPVVTTETLTSTSQKPVIEFMLFDSITNSSFSHVTYFVTIEKDGKKLLSDWFHDHAGILRIQGAIKFEQHRDLWRTGSDIECI